MRAPTLNALAHVNLDLASRRFDGDVSYPGGINVGGER
jgi:hypothetical protein